MPRKLANWLQAYREYTDGTEPPEVFHLWVALGTLAGAAQRKIYMDTGYYQIHSNMFVILVSPPGRGRKSTALRIGKDLLKGVTDYGVEINFSTQASSVAALIKQLASIKSKDHQSLTAYSSELGSLLGSKTTEVTDFLTDIYDCNPDWDKQTVGRGLELIERPWLNLLAATTPHWMGENLSKTATEGGFVSRSVFIYAERNQKIAFPELTEEQRRIKRYLMHDLAEIAKFKGRFEFSPEARELYKNWYEGQSDSSHVDQRLASFFERKPAYVLKLAMLLSLAEEDRTILTVRDIELALALLTDVEPGMKQAFSAVGKNVLSTDLDRLRIQIRTTGGIAYKNALAANIHSISKDEFDKLLHSLIEMGEVVYDHKKRWIAPAKQDV